MRRHCLVMFSFVACGASRTRAPEPPPPPEAISGFWELADGSRVEMQVALVGGTPQIDAWSVSPSGDPDVHFAVTDARWDGAHLEATFTYPASQTSKTTTRSELTLVNTDRLEGKVTGAYSASETWVRIPPPGVVLRADAGT